MRRADRLFQIIQILRRSSRPVTAGALAEELEVSKRSVYRDVADLIGQRVPIQGEAGLGYVLDSDFDMPPLMLTPDEVEAAVLGAQLVVQRGDPVLARAARDLIAKVATARPRTSASLHRRTDRRCAAHSCAGYRRLGHRENPLVDSQWAQNPDSLSKPKGARQRALHLAGYHRLCGDSSSAGSLVRVAPGI